MTDQDLARALSGATRECPAYVSEVLNEQQGIPPKQHPTNCYDGCHGTGRVFVLGERARKACPGCPDCKLAAWVTLEPYVGCHGDGWLSTLLEEPEACRDCGGSGRGKYQDPDAHLSFPCETCDGSGTIQAWRIGLLIELLEEADCKVALTDDRWGVRILAAGKEMHWSASLAVAACKALGTNTEVKG